MVSTIPSIAIVLEVKYHRSRRLQKRIDGHRRRWGCTVPSISRERSSRLVAFSTGVPLLLLSSRLDHSYPHSLVLHPSFLLSLNSRRATVHSPLRSLSSTSLDLFFLLSDCLRCFFMLFFSFDLEDQKYRIHLVRYLLFVQR